MKNRNLFYTNSQSGGVINPMMNNMAPMMPSGYNQNMNYMSYGPAASVPAPVNPNTDIVYGYTDDNLESRLTRLERQYRKLETRVSALESSSDIIIDDTTNNMYMI